MKRYYVHDENLHEEPCESTIVVEYEEAIEHGKEEYRTGLQEGRTRAHQRIAQLEKELALIMEDS